MKFLHSLTIRTRLLAGFATLALVAVFIGALGINTISRLSANTDDMFDNQLTPVRDLANANMQAIYMNRALFDYIIEEQKSGMDRIKLSIDEHYKLYNQLYDKYKATELTPPEKELIRKVDAAWPTYLAVADKVMRLSYADQNKEAYAEMNTAARKAFQDLDNYLSDLVDLNTQIAEDTKKTSSQSAASTRNMTIGVIVVAALISVMLGLLITASITRPLGQGMVFSQAIAAGDMTARLDAEGKDEVAQLMRTLLGMRDGLVKVVSSVREGAESVSTASAQIAQGNQDLSSRTEGQAIALEQTAASMEELGSQVNHNADNARQASQLAARASTVATQGGDVVGRVVETMKGINDASRKIADIISVIDGIAFQTNILALNAAVEAARAGEQGRGFAVVASEVRSLAGRSAEAAKEIKSLINASVERVEQGTALVDEAGSTMTEVVASIRRVTDLVGEISSASNEQAAAVAQVGEAVIQMDQGTQQNAALVEEMAAAANSLKTQATDLVATVAIFKLDAAHRVAAGTLPQAAPMPAVRRMAVPQPPRTKATPAAKPAGPVALPKPAAPAKTSAGTGKDEWESF